MKQQILSEISQELSALGIPIQQSNGADITIATEFINAGWSTGTKKISYEASVFLNEQDSVAYMYEKTTEIGSGMSFEGGYGTTFQSGKTLYRKVKSVQYAPDGKAYEISLDLGAIPKIVSDAAKEHGWKFKTVLKKDQASYPPGFIPSQVNDQKQEEPGKPQTDGFCANCGAPLELGAKFCKQCGFPVEKSEQAAAAPVKESSETTANQSPAPYSDPKGKLFAQGKKPASHDKDHRPLLFNSLLFWAVWAVLALSSVVMIFDNFSVLRCILLVAATLLPIVLRKKLFNTLVPSLFFWLLTFVIFVVVILATSTSPRALQTNDALSVQNSGNVAVSVLKGTMPDGSSISVKKDSNPPNVNAEGITYDAYDITLPSGSESDSVAEIVMPFDKNMVPSGMTPEDVLSVAYYNPTLKTWEPVPYVINTDKGTVAVLTDHFSKYAVVYFKDGRKKLSAKLSDADGMPLSYFTGSELENIVSKMGSGSDSSKAIETAGWNKFNEYYGLTGAAGNLLSAAVGSTTVDNVNGLMTQAGAGFAFAQLAMDMYNGDNQAAVNNFVKNAANYSVAEWGGSAMGLASVGVTFIDYSLNKFAETALAKNLEKFEVPYKDYYKSGAPRKIINGMSVPRTAVDWYKVVKNIYLESETQSPKQFSAKIDAEITKYCDLFWKDQLNGVGKIEDPAFGVGGEYALGVPDISKNYKQYIYKTTMQPVMAVLLQKISLREYNKANATYEKLKSEMNQEHTVTVNLANYSKVKDLTKTMVRFKNNKGQVIHSQSFDSSGHASLKISLFGFLKAECPTTVEVSVPAQDNTPAYSKTFSYKLNNTTTTINAPYTPVAIPTQKPPVVKPVTPPVVVPPTPKPSQPTQPKAEYDYNAALAAWAADFAGETNKRQYDNGTCKTTFTFEWVNGPFIKDGQVMGAYRTWETDTYYDGSSRKDHYISFEFYDANTPGVCLSTGELKKKYPQFGN